MELDSRLIEYMKKKAEYAKLVACALAVQSFVLAVFFCIYGLLQGYFVYSRTLGTARTVVITLSIIIAIILGVLNIFVTIKYKDLQKFRPDKVAFRQSADTVREAYIIARPHLIYRITESMLIMVGSGLVYIILVILMDRSMMAGIYGRIVVSICIAFAIVIGVPAAARIEDYRAALGEIHSMEHATEKWLLFQRVVAILLPGSISTWYILRFYTDYNNIAWIVFPMVILFGLAFVFLIEYVREEDKEINIHKD